MATKETTKETTGESDNQDQIDFWNGNGGDTWVEESDWLDALLQPISDATMAHMNLQAGDRVVDIGCGCGSTSMALAAQGAAVWGVDVSAPMLGLAKQRAAKLKDVVFSCADASTQKYTPDHQWVFSRFGVMFFAEPIRAFANIRTALAPGGQLCFVCWQTPKENPWMSVAGAAISPFLPKPDTAPDPKAPGPFAFADKGYLRSTLQIAGFQRVKIEGINPTLRVGADVDEAMKFQSKVGPLSRAVGELEGDVKDQALAAARDALAAHETPDGIFLGSACWVVTAQG